jgi:D-methionine transport system ATP-binding protein
MAQVPMIEIKDLSKEFVTAKSTVKALQSVNLTIEKSDIFGIIGISGAGKSTLVRCINYLEKPTSGTIIFDGQDLSKFNEKQIQRVRRSMGMIFQQFNLLMQRNALKNIMFPLEVAGVPKDQAKARAKELLDLVGLSDKENAYPSQLSGGQKQRIAIARALATEPKVLLCDEATSALDPGTTKEVLALLKDINRRLGVTVVLITHEMSVIEEICNKVAVIDQNTVVETGLVTEVFTKPKSQAAKRLFLGEYQKEKIFSQRCCRIVFDGNSSFDPVIAGMVLETGEAVNIMFADTKNIDGKAYGQIIIQLPEKEIAQQKILSWLENHNLTVEEVTNV